MKHRLELIIFIETCFWNEYENPLNNLSLMDWVIFKIVSFLSNEYVQN